MMWRLLGGPFRFVAEKVVVDALRRTAEGQNGPAAQRLYWLAAGHKRWISLLLGFVALCLSAFDDAQAAAFIGTVAAVLLAAGLGDAGMRANAMPEITNTLIYRLARAHAQQLATLAVAALTYLASTGCDPVKIGDTVITCALMFKIALAVALAFGYVGIYDLGLLSKAPVLGDRLGDALRKMGTPPPPPPPAAIVIMVASLLGSWGCVTAQASIGRSARQAFPDPLVLLEHVCRGGVEGPGGITGSEAARLYLAHPAYQWLGPQLESYLSQARRDAARGRCVRVQASSPTEGAK